MSTYHDKTPLSMVMNHLHVTSAELASAIHVDASLVSRWRNGKRSFIPSSEHYQSTIEYLLSKDEHLDYMNLAFFLGNYLPDIPMDSKQAITKALNLFLAGNFSPSGYRNDAAQEDDSSQAVLNIIRNTVSIRASLLEFLDLALTFEKDRNIYLMFDKRSDIFFENEKWYDRWIDKLKLLSDSGHNIYYIYNDSSAYSNIVNLDNFIHLYQSDNFHAFSMRKGGRNSFDLLLIEGAFAITSFSASGKGNTAKSVLYSTTSPVLLNSILQSCYNILDICDPLFRSQEEQSERISRLLRGLHHVNQDVFLYSRSPLDFPVSSKLFLKILDYNKIKGTERSTIIKRYETFIREPFMKSSQVNSSVIVNLDSFLNFMNYSEFELYPKLLSERPIIVPKDYYHYFINSLMQVLTEPDKSEFDYSVSVAFSSEAGLPKNSLVYTVPGIFAYIDQRAHDTQHHYIFTNPVFILDIFNFLLQVKSKLPDESNDKNRIISLLEQFVR